MENEMDPNEEVAWCTDCLSVIPDSMALKDPFLAAGQEGICPFCKGPVLVVPSGQVENLRDRRRRGDQF